jgi:hypothetical protein
VVLAKFDLADKFGLSFFLRSPLGPTFSALVAFFSASFRSRAAVQLGILALRHQFGVRIALGAHPKQILSLVLGRGRRLATSGVVLGHFRVVPSAGSFPSGPSSRSGHVRWAALLLLMVALGACYGLARPGSPSRPGDNSPRGITSGCSSRKN